MPLAWITGANGLIGSHIVRLASECAPGWEVLPITRERLDLTDFEWMRRLFREFPPQLIIHCAALSKSPACQANPSLAHLLNVEVTARLAELSANIPFVFFSTDLVFDGRRGNYDETAELNPLSVYGETKVAAEQIVLHNTRHLVIRTSLNGGVSPTGDRGFNEEMHRALLEGRKVKLFIDEFRCPAPASATARAAWDLALQNLSGIYHVAGSERLSRWDIGNMLVSRWNDVMPNLEAGSLREYRGAPRAPDTSLNCGKAQNRLSFPLPAFTQWLAANPHEPF